uniref:Uncharacterized protein n=1 Tax=Anguilla anguilla TaxID=7936 RepID=A0A0E9TXJ2_ANGAN
MCTQKNVKTFFPFFKNRINPAPNINAQVKCYQ